MDDTHPLHPLACADAVDPTRTGSFEVSFTISTPRDDRSVDLATQVRGHNGSPVLRVLEVDGVASIASLTPTLTAWLYEPGTHTLRVIADDGIRRGESGTMAFEVVE